MFGTVLKEAGAQTNGPLFVFLDGLDLLRNTHQETNMDWIPQNIPKVRLRKYALA